MANNLIHFPSSKHMESRISIKPKLIAVDFEYFRNALDTKFLLAEVAFIDVKTGELIDIKSSKILISKLPKTPDGKKVSSVNVIIDIYNNSI